MNPTELTRYALLGGLLIVGYLLVLAWNDDYGGTPATANATAADADPFFEAATARAPDAQPTASAVPDADVPTATPTPDDEDVTSERAQVAGLVRVRTDTLNVWIDLRGGDIVKVTLPGYPVSLERPDVPFTLLDRSPSFTYLAQSGLTGPDGVDRTTPGRPLFSTDRDLYELGAGEDLLEVPLSYVDDRGISWTKRFSFTRDAYHVDVRYIVDNASGETLTINPYAQIKRSPGDPPGSESPGMGPQPYVGAAFTSEDDRYEKIDADDLEDGPFELRTDGGWVAMLQHYFLGAWIPGTEGQNVYQGRLAADGAMVVGYVGPATRIGPGESGTVGATFYAGPKIQDTLAGLAPYLNLTVDYGMLWWIAAPLFSLLDLIQGLVGNWGVAIILLTLVVKLVLYPLSAASYRSMANMRKVAPEMKRLQERYGDDRQKLSQEMMELYRKERINPLGGCFPLLLQMPVFLALYWVLYEAVELRQAPFMLWIDDLADLDPFFVLPLLMGASMFFQQTLNPPPPDPMQAKVLKIMPVMFTVLFLFFPAGLVLYWLVNNVLSMAQQWWITRQIERGAAQAA
jgi:YidC/Oxa1 family membrane protein insertase